MKWSFDCHSVKRQISIRTINNNEIEKRMSQQDANPALETRYLEEDLALLEIALPDRS
jgi:hypothetical protein